MYVKACSRQLSTNRLIRSTIHTMNDVELEAIAANLDTAVSKEEGRLDLQFEEPRYGIRLVANRAGFVRLAVECLRASTAPLQSGREVLQVDWKYLFVQGSAIVTRISRTESVAPLPPVRLGRRERAANLALTILALAFVTFLIISTIVGGVTILGKISSHW